MRIIWKIIDFLWACRFFLSDPWSTSEHLTTWGTVRLWVRPRTSDAYVAHEVFASHDYPVEPRGIVVDLGANIGAFTLYAAQTASQVYAFEPSHENYTQLCKNIEENHVTNVTPLKLAVSGTPGTATLFRTHANKGATTLTVAMSDNTEEVEVTTLERFMLDRHVSRINLLKIDIEGSEHDLFTHITPDTLEKIDALVMEIHPTPGARRGGIETRLREAGFTVTTHRTLLSLFGLYLVRATRPH